MDLNNTHQQYPSQQQNSGLSRYRSAPSSLLPNSCGGFDSKRLISGFMTHPNGNNTSSDSPTFPEFEDKSGLSFRNADSEFSLSSSQLNCQQLPPQYPRQSNTSHPTESSYGLVGSMAMDLNTQARTISSNIMRQNSSPAGLFTQISVQNGYAPIKGMGNYGLLNGASREISPSASTLKSQMSFSSGLASSLGVLSQISEVGNEGIEANNSVDVKLRNGQIDARFCSPGFPYGSWNDSSLFPENITVTKREQDSDTKSFPVNQRGELGNRAHLLSHHLSLPKTSSELGAIEKILHFQDTVPCKIRAKRGCATHPRSIAERMRRTRISERMRKLQELVPHMDKQTNTADMLDLAVEYIKDLQKQFKILNDSRANCKCSSAQKSVSNQAS